MRHKYDKDRERVRWSVGPESGVGTVPCVRLSNMIGVYFRSSNACSLSSGGQLKIQKVKRLFSDVHCLRY